MEFRLDIVLALVFTVAAGLLFFLYYIGYFYKVKITAGRSIISEVKIAYKFHQGNYNKCGEFFAETGKLYPDLRALAIYYDNPDKVDPNTCRYIVGLIIAEGIGQNAAQSVVRNLDKHSFKFATLPHVENSVKTTHPFTMVISAYFAGWKAYPALMKFIENRKLNAHPFLEIYFDKTIHYMVPLDSHEDFYMDEVKDMLKN